jgi:hypothetical protein
VGNEGVETQLWAGPGCSPAGMLMLRVSAQQGFQQLRQNITDSCTWENGGVLVQWIPHSTVVKSCYNYLIDIHQECIEPFGLAYAIDKTDGYYTLHTWDQGFLCNMHVQRRYDFFLYVGCAAKETQYRLYEQVQRSVLIRSQVGSSSR